MSKREMLEKRCEGETHQLESDLNFCVNLPQPQFKERLKLLWDGRLARYSGETAKMAIPQESEHSHHCDEVLFLTIQSYFPIDF